jgi:hypothetical protein
MQPQLLDDWVALLLPTYSIRKIATICRLSRTEFEQSEMLKDRMLYYSIFGDAPRKPLLKSSK